MATDRRTTNRLLDPCFPKILCLFAEVEDVHSELDVLLGSFLSGASQEPLNGP